MNDSDNSSKEVSSWVFLSHSNGDYDKVAILRDMLEEQKKRPIMFYLKCLENPAYRKELERLLKREIDAREQFILCDSENARKSEWVQEEVKYIKSKGRKYQTIDIEADPESIRKAVSDFVNRDKIFLSYTYLDSSWARAISKALTKRGFSVINNELTKRGSSVILDENDLDFGGNLAQSFTNRIDESDRQGYQICLLSRAFCRSEWCHVELEYILNHTQNKGDWLLLVMLEDIPQGELPDSIKKRNIPIRLTTRHLNRGIELIVKQFMEMERSHNQ